MNMSRRFEDMKLVAVDQYPKQYGWNAPRNQLKVATLLGRRQDVADAAASRDMITRSWSCAGAL